MKSLVINYLVFTILLFAFIHDSFCFSEQWRTFYWDAAYCREVIAQAGLWQLVTDFFTQFQTNKYCISLLLAIPLTLAGQVVLYLLQRLQRRFVPAAPGIALSVAQVLLYLLCIVIANLTESDSDRFKGMMCMVEDENWDGIIGECEDRRVTNLLEQNMLNLALAETGLLEQRLTQQPCRDVNSLFVLQIESPYVAALLSDIYWSMGEISMSQMYAFEANEKMDNLSPRLLKRLVLTNIVFGHYRVAEKYLNWLDKTLFYREWSAHYRTMLSDEAVMADPVLRLKRACIPAENVFPSAQSVAYDLQQIIDRNPEHRTSAAYLGALKRLYGMQ